MNSYTAEFRAVVPRFRFSYALGVTASHCDTLCYRAMLARVRARKKWNATPADAVRFELHSDCHELTREYLEQTEAFQ